MGGKERFSLGVEAGTKAVGIKMWLAGRKGWTGRGYDVRRNRRDSWRGRRRGREQGADPAGHISGKRGVGGWVSLGQVYGNGLVMKDFLQVFLG